MEPCGGIAEGDDADHEQKRSDEGDDAVLPRVTDEVVDVFGSEVELSGDVFAALDHQEAAFGVSDHHVAWRCTDACLAFRKVQLPFITQADEGGQERERQGGEDSPSIFLPDGQGKENPSFEGSKKSNPPKGAPFPGLDIVGVWLANDLYATNGIGWKRLAVTAWSSVV